MEPQAPLLNPNLRLLCSYGGHIMSLPSLHYTGGETRFVVVPRGISFFGFFKLLSDKLLSGRSFSLKYKLPGCDLDSLISVFDYDDLQNMIAQYDSTRFRRIRLFLFPLNHPELRRQPRIVNRFESPIFTSSYSVLASPIFPPNLGPPQFVHGNKVHSTAADENRRRDEAAPTTSASMLPPENTTAADNTGEVSERETEMVEVQDQSRPIVQEPLPQQQPLIICSIFTSQSYAATYG